MDEKVNAYTIEPGYNRIVDAFPDIVVVATKWLA